MVHSEQIHRNEYGCPGNAAASITHSLPLFRHHASFPSLVSDKIRDVATPNSDKLRHSSKKGITEHEPE